MVSHNIVTNRKETNQKISSLISANKKGFIRKDRYFNFSAKVIEDVKKIIIGGNSTFSR